MSISRRSVLMSTTALAAVGATAWGFGSAARSFAGGLLGEVPTRGITGNSWEAEYKVDASGRITPNPNQRIAYTMCSGCTSNCGIRVRVDKQTNRIVRVTGNPYSPMSTNPHLPYETPVADALTGLSRHGERGLDGRSTACGRGNAVLAKQTDPFRVLRPLKRVGKRGGGQWQEISWTQLIEEVVEGGDLFGEGHVDGLRAIRDLKTPIDPDNPEFGSKANRLAVMAWYKNGRLPFAARFAKLSYGTRNFVGHSSYCGLSIRAGYAALLDDFKKLPHLKPDYPHAKYLLFIGTAPGNAGNPYKRQGNLIADARTAGGVRYAVVDPVLTNAQNLASGDDSQWVPIRPGTDGALVMGMIRWILENDRFDANFLAQPSAAAAKAAGEASWSNATHLVIDSADHVRAGAFLRFGMVAADAPKEDKGKPICLDAESGALVPAGARPARLFHEGEVTLADGSTVRVATSLSLLRREAQRLSLAEYSKACGVPEERIVGLARDFTSYGKQASVDSHGGTMHAAGFYTAYAIVMLNAMVGNLNVKGGTTAGGGRYADIAKGPRYNLKAFPGKVKPKGIDIGRGGFAYEKTSEYKRHVAAGENPYPAKAPWHSFSQSLGAHYLASMLEGYPYPAKALITWSSNPLYGVAGLNNAVAKRIADPKRLPLMVSIDPFINETSRFADYVVPDRIFFEGWGWATAWGGVPTKMTTARWPVVDCATDRLPDGRHMDMETFFIDVALRLGLPGFGDKAIPDAEGNLHPLRRAEDFWLRAGANVAFDGQPVAESADADMALTGTDRFRDLLKTTLKADEWRRVAYVYDRGGRFQHADGAYKGDRLAKAYPKGVQVWNETVATARNSMTGTRFVGCPTWQSPSLADGTPVDQQFPPSEWPFRLSTTKSQLRSSHTPGLSRLNSLRPANAVAINADDAAALGIVTGDRVRVTSPGGAIEGLALVRHGIAHGALSVEHGFGHRELGAHTRKVANRVFAGQPARATGVNSNDLGYRDPSASAPMVMADPVVGSIARQAIPARVEKLSSEATAA